MIKTNKPCCEFHWISSYLIFSHNGMLPLLKKRLNLAQKSKLCYYYKEQSNEFVLSSRLSNFYLLCNILHCRPQLKIAIVSVSPVLQRCAKRWWKLKDLIPHYVGLNSKVIPHKLFLKRSRFRKAVNYLEIANPMADFVHVTNEETEKQW